jgi:hypothetical protein
MELLPLTLGVAAAGIAYLIIGTRVHKAQEWAAGAFFVYGAAGWATKVIYEAIVQPRFGSPLPVFVGGGMIVAIVFAVIVRRKLRAR